ncbi:MAG TPA: hypothetical protein DCM40_03410, partial [Maribacter sp.]|nr:hypothetical protein [Maribacter sp.]
YTDKLIYIQSNLDLKTTASSNSVVETVKFPVRIIGSNDASIIKTNQQWKSIVLGGEYEDKVYPGIINQGVFNDFTFQYSMPYSRSRARELYNVLPNVTDPSLITFDIVYHYKDYLPEYQNAIKNVPELLIPNVYMLQMVDDSEFPDTGFANYITDFVSLSDPESSLINGDAIGSIFKPVKNVYPPTYAVKNSEIDITTYPNIAMYEDKSHSIREYLTGAFVDNQINEETIGQVIQKSKHLFFTSESEDLLDTVHDNINKMPMYCEIRYPIDPSRTDGYSQIIRDNELEEDFLLYLKNNFGTSRNDYITKTSELSSSFLTDESTGEVYYDYKSTVGDESMSTSNFLSALVTMYNSTTNENTTNTTFMNERTLSSIS